jgi:hypothetical protein
MANVSGLSGNEIYCMALKNYRPGGLVVGNSVNSLGFLRDMSAGFRLSGWWRRRRVPGLRALRV